MCPAQYEHIFSQAAAQLSEEEWLALFDFGQGGLPARVIFGIQRFGGPLLLL